MRGSYTLHAELVLEISGARGPPENEREESFFPFVRPSGPALFKQGQVDISPKITIYLCVRMQNVPALFPPVAFPFCLCLFVPAQRPSNRLSPPNWFHGSAAKRCAVSLSAVCRGLVGQDP